MTAQAWLPFLGRQNCWTQWINMSSLRLNTSSNSILDESERPETSDLISYNYIYWKEKEILKLGRKRIVSRNIKKLPFFIFDSEAVYPKDLSNLTRPF